LNIGELFFDFEDVGHFLCSFEDFAKAISEGDLILDFGLKIAFLTGDVVLAATFAILLSSSMRDSSDDAGTFLGAW